MPTRNMPPCLTGAALASPAGKASKIIPVRTLLLTMPI
jgi:hypothetical protein